MEEGFTVILSPDVSKNSSFCSSRLQYSTENVSTFTLGRGSEGLNIDDKRCSRNQAKLELRKSNKSVIITRVMTT